MDEYKYCYSKWKRVHTVRFHLQEILEMAKFTVAERLMVARGWDRGWGGLPANGALENLRDDGRFHILSAVMVT